MVLIAFGFKDIRYFFKNIYYLYIVSILLGGFLYFIDTSFYYKKEGLIFINNGLSVNFVFALLLSPFLVYSYLKNVKDLKDNYNSYYDVEICINNKNMKLIGFLDTGNKLIDPYKKYPIILIKKDYINFEDEKIIYVPYNTVNNNGLLKCIKKDFIIINGNKIRKKYLIGTIDNINIDGVDLLLNKKILEDNYVN